MALDLGIKEGKSAVAMSIDVRQYLRNPNMLFRRVRDKRGLLQLSKRAKAFHPGQGVYRSSYKNARRLTATENNIAYRTADYLRYQQMDFVVGIQICLSNNHTVLLQPGETTADPTQQRADGSPKANAVKHLVDICDDLQGRYPKDFKFTGWHPHCRCHVITILKSKDEIKRDIKRLANGETVDNTSVNEVTELPKNFETWIKNNEERLKGRATLPYFIKDNQRQVNGILGIAEPKKKELSLLEIAEQRHAKRTQAQIDDIKHRWKEKTEKDKNTKLMANNVANLQSEYPFDVDFSKLKQYIDQNDLKKMRQEAKVVALTIKSVRIEEKALSDYIPSVHNWHKTFSLAEIKEAKDKIQSTVEYWQNKGYNLATDSNLDILKKEIEQKIKFVENPGLFKAGLQAHKTWKLQQEAYQTMLAKVEKHIEITEINAEYTALLGFKTTSKDFKHFMTKAKEAIAAEDVKNAKAYISSAQWKKKVLERNRKGKTATKSVSSQFGDDAYSAERKNNAVWDKSNGKLADDTLHDTAGKAWRAATELEKDKTYEYTHHYCNINEPLQGRQYVGPQTRKKFTERVDNITSYIDRNELPHDMWFTRGDDGMGVIASRIRFAGGTMPTNLQDLVGMIMQEGGFMSTGSRKGKGFGSKSVILNIYAPKGAKAAYIEPISAFGNGAGRSWNGIKKFTSYSNEHETLFQRGTKMRITKVYKADGKIYIDCEVIEQEIKDLSYIDDGNIGY